MNQHPHDRVIAHRWWDPERGQVTAANDRPAVDITLLYDRTRQQHWILENELDRAVHHLKIALRRASLGDNHDEIERCQKRSADGGECILYGTHLGDHQFHHRRRPVHDVHLPEEQQ